MNYIDAINAVDKPTRHRVIICLTEEDDKLVRAELYNRGYRWVSGANLMTKTYFDKYNISSYSVDFHNKTTDREDEKFYVEPYKNDPHYFENERFIVVNTGMILPDEDAFLELLSQS